MLVRSHSWSRTSDSGEFDENSGLLPKTPHQSEVRVLIQAGNDNDDLFVLRGSVDGDAFNFSPQAG